MGIKVRIDLDLTDEEFVYLVSQAKRNGLDIHPSRLRNIDMIGKDAVRFRVKQLVDKEVGRK